MFKYIATGCDQLFTLARATSMSRMSSWTDGSLTRAMGVSMYTSSDQVPRVCY